MKRAKLGWSLVLTFSTAALIGYGVWGFNFIKNNNTAINNANIITNNNDNLQSYRNFGGRMGRYGMRGGYRSQNNITSSSYINEAAANKQMEDSLKNAAIDKNNNTITFSGKTIAIVMFASPESADEKFVVGGLINPTIQVPVDAAVSLEIVNEDVGIPHGIEITSAAPPFAYMSMMQGNVYANSIVSPLPAATKDNYPSAVTNFTTSESGTFYYLCEYPSHAATGMYGKFIVK
jgi:rusticyanin